MKYRKLAGLEATPQSEALLGEQQVKNNAGGFVYEVSKWTHLMRFLVLGTDAPTYYASAQKMTREAAACVAACLKEDGQKTVQLITEVSTAGRAPKNDPAIFALAMACRTGDLDTRRAAYDALSKVCRIGTHLFQWHEAIKSWPGRGSRLMNRAIGKWFTEKEEDQLAYQMVKYRQREGWTPRDVLRLAKPRMGDSALIKWAVGKDITGRTLPRVVEGFIKIQSATTAREVINLLKEYPMLPWEAIPTEHLKSKEVWAQLITTLPPTALIRNLGRISSLGLTELMSSEVGLICKKLMDGEAIKKARVHPINLLAALGVYQTGHGIKGNLTWQVNGRIVDALNEAFYLAFPNVEPAGKRTLIGLDVSGSMGTSMMGMPGLSCRDVSAALSLVTMRTEQEYGVIGFTGGSYHDRHSGAVTPLDISARQRLDDVIKRISHLPFGPTDCALPMLYAQSNGIKVDTFIIFTDNETWHGKVHPKQALVEYRRKSGIPARLVVVGMTATQFSIADPLDPGMLDVVGCDTAMPTLINDFSRGSI